MKTNIASDESEEPEGIYTNMQKPKAFDPNINAFDFFLNFYKPSNNDEQSFVTIQY